MTCGSTIQKQIDVFTQCFVCQIKVLIPKRIVKKIASNNEYLWNDQAIYVRTLYKFFKANFKYFSVF